MKELIIFLFILFIGNQVFSKLPEQKRQNLLNKLTKEITFDNLDEFKNIRFDFESSSLKDGINYDPARIKKIIEENDFPEEYNFLEDTNATVHVKDQQSCGCCWSHAATTALAYRYHKIGIEVDLSPQDALSCYLRDCEGNYLIDAQMNLVKNGTVTEGCLPFSSGDGRVVDECPTSCKDGSEYKKYFSQNLYETLDYYSEDSFYDIVTLIMDQLTTNGPLVSQIDVYQDFIDLNNNPQKCRYEVYHYDEKSDWVGGHNVVIVGYGLLNGKYYWLIQNSWGEEVCDHGFIKVEFGQVGVESVAFSAPYLPGDPETPTDINVSFKSINEVCDIEVATNSSLTKWENTLEITFQNTKGIKDFNYQCGVNSFSGGNNKLNCYYEVMNSFTFKGNYVFKTSRPLGTENKFILDDSFDGKSFKFWGYDTISPFYYIYFISEEGNRIMFRYKTTDESILPPIYPNEENSNALSNCNTLNNIKGVNFIYCDITKEELQYFNYPQSTYLPLVFDILCEYKQPILYVCLFDKQKYASFKIIQFKIKSKIIIDSTELDLVSKIEGNLDNYKNSNNSFISFINVEKNNINSTEIILCYIGQYKTTVTQTELKCNVVVSEGEKIRYDNLYLLPYYMTYTTDYPFQIIINDTIKADYESDHYFSH